MSGSGKRFEVAKVLKRRIKKGKIEYQLMWKIDSSKSWEPEENLSCPVLLNDFMAKIAHKILSVKQNDDGTIEYLMRWKDGFKESVINSNEMKQKWPFLLMEFLETRLHIFIPANPTLNVIDFPLSAGNATGNPKEVHYVSDFGFEINYWVEFQNGMCKFVKSDEMKTNWPLLAAVYLEEHLSFN